MSSLYGLFLLVFVQTGAIDYCSEHTFEQNNSLMEFTKEMISEEYAVEGGFKALHCCTKGLRRSIEWYVELLPLEKHNQTQLRLCL